MIFNILLVKNYYLEVYTGDVDNAGTDATVYVKVYGKYGDTGKRKLLQSQVEGDKFERGKVSDWAALSSSHHICYS